MQQQKILFLIFFFFIFFGYAQKKESNNFTITGKIDTLAHSKYYVSYKKEGVYFVDSLQLDANKEFEYSGYITEPTRLSLEVDNIYDSRQVGNLYVYDFWIEPEDKLDFVGEKFNLNGSRYKLTGSSKTEEISKKYSRELWNLWQEDKERYSERYTEISKKFFEEIKGTYYGLTLLYSMIRHDYEEEGFVKVKTQEAIQLNPELKRTYLYQEIEKKLRFMEGKKLPDYTLFDTNNQEQSLYPFSGKVILVDFWASWCGPCRKLHPHLKEIYDLYHSKGFDIVSISLDDNKERWLKAIEQDEMIWTNLSDLKGVRKGIAKEFAITGVPQSFLIDTNGIILAKVSGFDEKTLSAKLEEFLLKK